jgi:hypothetical protein
MRLPPAGSLRRTFQEQGFVLVRECLSDRASAGLAALARDVLDRHGVRVTRRSGGEALDYRVVTGDVIRAEAPPIYALYGSDALLTWIRDVSAVDGVDRSPHVRSAVNINGLDTSGQRYPWHNDAVPFTALLFLTTLADSAGGEFLIRAGGEDVTAIRPERGLLLLMDGQRCAHAVAPLREAVSRLTVPMVFPAVPAERPAGLDEFLYQVAE